MIRIRSYKPGESRPYVETQWPKNRLTCEISTHWLGFENPGMNVAIYVPEYTRWERMLLCVYPGGRFEMTWDEDFPKG